MTKTATIQAQQKWEYMELTRRTETYLLSELQEVGLQGWELVSVVQGKDRKGETAWTGFLKRPHIGHHPPSGGSATDTVRVE